MPDQWGRPTASDGFQIAGMATQMKQAGLNAEKRQADKDAYTVAEAMKAGGDISGFSDEAKYKGAQLRWTQDLGSLDQQLRKKQLSESGYKEKVAQIELTDKKGHQLSKQYWALRRSGNNDAAKKIAHQFNNEVAYNGMYVEPEGDQLNITKWDHSKQTIPDMSIEEYDSLLAGYENMPEEELKKRQLSGEQLRVQHNLDIVSKAVPYYNPETNKVIYQVPAGTWQPDGTPRGAFFVDTPGSEYVLPPEQAQGFMPLATAKGQQEIKKGGLDIEGKQLDNQGKEISNQKSRIVSPTNMVTGEGGQQGPAMLNESGTGLSIAPVEGGLKETQEKPSVSDQNAIKDQQVDDLKAVLLPFNEKGGTIIDFETGELTQSGKNALDSAMKLIEKHQGKQELTAAEKKKVPHAYRAWKMYEEISKSRSATSDGDWRQYQ